MVAPLTCVKTAGARLGHSAVMHADSKESAAAETAWSPSGDLLRRFDLSGPRYTSYPTADPPPPPLQPYARVIPPCGTTPW